jgi:hypothetical protein
MAFGTVSEHHIVSERTLSRTIPHRYWMLSSAFRCWGVAAPNQGQLIAHCWCSKDFAQRLPPTRGAKYTLFKTVGWLNLHWSASCVISILSLTSRLVLYLAVRLQAAEAVPALTGVTGGDGIRHLRRLWCWFGVGLKGASPSPSRYRSLVSWKSAGSAVHLVLVSRKHSALP